jgi:serine/threonine-protein phosphatase 2A regulatory subunit A
LWCSVFSFIISERKTNDQFYTCIDRRVRNKLAKSFSDVAISLNLNSNPELYQSQKALTMACFVSLLQDVEGEVRTSAVTHLAPMVHWGGPELFQSHLSPLLPALADDSVVDVRTKCALGIMDSMEGGTLADSTIVKTFGPLLENFLQDEYSEVQLHVLSNLSRISHLLHQLSGVVTTILNMAKASNWRVREGVAQLLPHLADARGMDFFSSVLLEPAWLALLLDPVCSVRIACVDGVARLVRVAGEEWIVASLLPQHLKIYAHSESAYLMRMTILRAHAQMALASQRGNLFYQVVDFLCETGLKDKVSNVRMVTAKGLHLVCQSEESDPDVVQSKIRRAVEEQLAIEDDADCVYFMTECLQSC